MVSLQGMFKKADIRNLSIATIFILVLFFALNLEAKDVFVSVSGPGVPPAFQEVPSGTVFQSCTADKATLDRQARCTTGYMNASILNMKIADVQVSIDSVTSILSILADAKDYIKTFSTKKDADLDLNSFLIGGIPGPEIKDNFYEKANRITMKCPIGVESVPTPVGILASTNDPVGLDHAPRESLEALDLVIKIIESINKEVAEKIKKEIEKRLNEGELAPEEPSEEVKAGIFKIIRASFKIKSLMSEHFIPMDVSNLDLNRIPNLVVVGFSYGSTTPNGVKIRATDTVPLYIRAFFNANPFTPSIPKEPPGAWMIISIGLKINAEVKGVHVSKSAVFEFPNVLLPERPILHVLTKETDSKIEKYEKIKKALEKKRNDLQNQLATLQSNNYNCQ